MRIHLETEIPTIGTQFVYNILFVDAVALLENHKIIDYEFREHKKMEWDYGLTAFYASDHGLENLMINMKGDVELETSTKEPKPGKLMFELSPSDIRNMVNIFYNSILYINDSSRNRKDTEIVCKRNFRVAKGGEFINSNYILLKPPSSYKFSSKGSGHKLDKRFVVRGHWRNQAHGEGMKERKQLWIKPHWKGPELSEVVNKTYKLGG